MVNNVTVILVVRDVHVRLTLHPLARTVPVPSNVRRHNNRVYFGCVIVSTVDRLNNTTRRHECVPQRMFAWLTINTKLRVPYRTDSDTVTVRYSSANKGIKSTFLISTWQFPEWSTDHANRFQSRGHSLPTPKELRALNDCWANGWRWHLAEAQAANDSVRYSSRSALRSQFAHPERITRPGRLLNEWVVVTLSGIASSQWQCSI